MVFIFHQSRFLAAFWPPFEVEVAKKHVTVPGRNLRKHFNSSGVCQMGPRVAAPHKLLNPRELSRRDRISAVAAGRGWNSHTATGNSMDGMDELDRMDIDATLVKIGEMATIPLPCQRPPSLWTRALRPAHCQALPGYDCPYFSLGVQLLLAKVARRLRHVLSRLFPAQGRPSRLLICRLAN